MGTAINQAEAPAHRNGLVTKISAAFMAFAAMGSLAVTLWVANQLHTIRVEVQDVHLTVNSRMTEMIELTKRASRAAGVEAERLRQENQSEEKDRQ